MRQGYCYTCLAIGQGISVGSLRASENLSKIFMDSQSNMSTKTLGIQVGQSAIDKYRMAHIQVPRG